MTAPNTNSSTKEERLDYVLNEWRDVCIIARYAANAMS